MFDEDSFFKRLENILNARERRYLTRKEAMDYLRVGGTTFNHYLQIGLKQIKVDGGQPKYDKKDLDEFMKEWKE